MRVLQYSKINNVDTACSILYGNAEFCNFIDRSFKKLGIIQQKRNKFSVNKLKRRGKNSVVLVVELFTKNYHIFVEFC